MYCNTPSPEIKQHKRVRWYQIVLGSSDAVHVPTISGLTSGAGSEMTIIGPGMTHIKDFTADNYGKWLLHDAVVNQTSQGNVKCCVGITRKWDILLCFAF